MRVFLYLENVMVRSVAAAGNTEDWQGKAPVLTDFVAPCILIVLVLIRLLIGSG